MDNILSFSQLRILTMLLQKRKPSTDFMEYVLQQWSVLRLALIEKEAMKLAVDKANDLFKTDYTVPEVVSEILDISETEDLDWSELEKLSDTNEIVSEFLHTKK